MLEGSCAGKDALRAWKGAALEGMHFVHGRERCWNELLKLPRLI
ncbi:MAG: hypothetical protein ACTSQ8_12840 [Candidatus Helarchaeota archaeon]